MGFAIGMLLLMVIASVASPLVIVGVLGIELGKRIPGTTYPNLVGFSLALSMILFLLIIANFIGSTYGDIWIYSSRGDAQFLNLNILKGLCWITLGIILLAALGAVLFLIGVLIWLVVILIVEFIKWLFKTK